MGLPMTSSAMQLLDFNMFSSPCDGVIYALKCCVARRRLAGIPLSSWQLPGMQQATVLAIEEST